MRGRLLEAIIALLPPVVIAAGGGCVDERCSRNSECPVGRVCVAATGECVVPECIADRDCGEGHRCYGNRCVEAEGPCNCFKAPAFCGTDINPSSPTSGREVCVPGDFPGGVALFFGSVACPHCRTIYAGLTGVQQDLAAAGEEARLVFVQIMDVVASPPDVAEALPAATEPVVQDTPELGIWSAYGTDWYHVLLVDREGCIADDIYLGTGQSPETVRTPWVAAMHAECSPPPEQAPEPPPDRPADLPPETPPDPGPDPVADAVPEPGAEPAPEAAEVPPEPAPDVAEPSQDLDAALDPLDVPADSGGEPAEAPSEPTPDVPAELSPEPPPEVATEVFVEPFELGPVCQVLDTPVAPSIGDPVPHFLCQDVNEQSPTYLAGVSDIVLREMVWIAYFGTCT